MLGWLSMVWAANVYLNGKLVPEDVLYRIDPAGSDVLIEIDGDVQISDPDLDWVDGHLVVRTVREAPPPPGWWLLAEDSRSDQMEIRIFVNGVLVKSFRSGERARLVPLGNIVHSGQNELRIEVASSSGSGRMAVLVGTGSSRSGVLLFDGTPNRWLVSGDAAGQPLVIRFESTAPAALSPSGPTR